LGEKVSSSGVVFNEAHRGYLKLIRDWGENGDPPLEEMCWEAIINVDPSAGVGIGEQDRGLTCAGLTGREYDDCMAGRWCSFDELNGEYICTDLANGLRLGFSDSCASYINDPDCTYQPSQTRCEEWGKNPDGPMFAYTKPTFSSVKSMVLDMERLVSRTMLKLCVVVLSHA
jgi:hypothetical protein